MPKSITELLAKWRAISSPTLIFRRLMGGRSARETSCGVRLARGGAARDDLNCTEAPAPKAKLQYLSGCVLYAE